MPASKPVVYLEDLEAPKSSPVASAVAEKEATVAVASKETAKTTADVSKTSTVTKTSTKRQASLMDMFSGSSSQPSKKRLRTENSIASVTSENDSSSNANAGQTLNSIPFSLSGYTASLSEEEKRLLGLECETMGKSW